MVLINALADAIGCSCEFVFSIVVVSHIQFPILAFSEASEQLFFFFLALVGRHNEPHYCRFTPRVIYADGTIDANTRCDDGQKWEQDTSEEKQSTPPQLCIDHFSFEELHNVMRRNNGQLLGLFDEMSTLHSLLDLFKHSGSVMDRKTHHTEWWYFMDQKLFSFNAQHSTV